MVRIAALGTLVVIGGCGGAMSRSPAVTTDTRAGSECASLNGAAIRDRLDELPGWSYEQVVTVLDDAGATTSRLRKRVEYVAPDAVKVIISDETSGSTSAYVIIGDDRWDGDRPPTRVDGALSRTLEFPLGGGVPDARLRQAAEDAPGDCALVVGGTEIFTDRDGTLLQITLETAGAEVTTELRFDSQTPPKIHPPGTTGL